MNATGDNASAGEIRVEDVRHKFGSVHALRGVSVTARPGEFLTFLGPSGSGKTTLLRIIGGLVEPTAGKVIIGGRDVTDLPPRDRGIGFVFQNYALFPHLSVFDNVAFALRLRKAGKATVREKVHRVLELVDLPGLDDRYPAQLSGGQQQRVSLARAIVFEPALLLMDEPLGSLDKRLREQLQVKLRQLQHKVGITTIYVTHDQEEAFAMSDRIAVMDHGQVRQLGTPLEIYDSPKESFVAGFVGNLNSFRGRLVETNDQSNLLRTTEGLEILVSADGTDNSVQHYVCGIRPEKVQISPDSRADNVYTGEVAVLAFQGKYHHIEVDLGSGQRLIAETRKDMSRVVEGDEMTVGWNAGDAFVFPDASDGRPGTEGKQDD